MAKTLKWEEKMQLQKWIGDGSKTFDLLFSIETHGCDSNTFHKFCDSKGPTVTVLYNINGSVFGGYTSISWRSLGQYQEDNNAFMFQLRHNDQQMFNKFPHRDGKKSIYDRKNYGPSFGSGPDLLTFEGRVEKENEYFPLNGKMKRSTYDMSGCSDNAINNGHMKVNDLEVYLVKDALLTEWRKTVTCWDEQTLTNLKDEISNFVYSTKHEIAEANILLIGPIAAGKSSFVNTIYSCFTGYYSTVAISACSEQSVTTKFRRHPVWMDGETLPFSLCDIPGLDDLSPEEIECILDGYVPDGYQFNTSVPFKVDSQSSIRNPSLMEQIHCVALVIDGSKLNSMQQKTLDKIKDLLKRMSRKDVPQVVLLTHVEKVCPLVNDDLSMIFKSGQISNLVKQTSSVIGLPSANVLPVKNYEGEQNAERNVDILALISMRQILRFANSFIQMKSLMKKKDK